MKKIREINSNLTIYFSGPKPLLGTNWVSINIITKNHKSALGMNYFLNNIKWIRYDEIDYVKELTTNLGVHFVDVSEVFCDDGCQFRKLPL